MRLTCDRTTNSYNADGSEPGLFFKSLDGA